MEIKQSENRVQINGIIAEMNLAQPKEKDVNLTGFVDGTKVEKKVKCMVIEKKEFKNPTFTIESNGNQIAVEYKGINFGITEKTLNKEGEIVDNDRYKALVTMMSKYVTKKDAINGEEPTRVTVNGSLSLNEYTSFKDDEDGKFVSIQQITANSISSTNTSEEDSADARISGVITDISPEYNGEDETGRLLITLVSFSYNSKAEPYKFVVEADLKDDFERYYEVGNSVLLSYEVTSRHVGSAVKQSGNGFGKREAKITSGYNVTEFSIFNGDEPFDEENELFVSVETVQQALAEREQMKAEKIAKDKEKLAEKNADSAKTSSPRGASASTKASPFGAPKKDNPFAKKSLM